MPSSYRPMASSQPLPRCPKRAKARVISGLLQLVGGLPLRCGNASCIRLALPLSAGLDSRIPAQLGVKYIGNSFSEEFGRRCKAPLARTLVGSSRSLIRATFSKEDHKIARARLHLGRDELKKASSVLFLCRKIAEPGYST